MENQLSFGTFEIPYLDNRESSTVSFIAPSILPSEMLKKISFDESSFFKEDEPQNYEVTHKIFFGENLKRAIAAFK
jgi:hypothetical protein